MKQKLLITLPSVALLSGGVYTYNKTDNFTLVEITVFLVVAFVAYISFLKGVCYNNQTD